jgi:putative ABC transport system ATP-binding protein
MSALGRTRFRKRHVGFMFQKFFLMPYLTAFDNIRMALALRGYRGKCEERIVDLATRLGMAERLGHRPSELSVGEQQRIAMARAVVAEPEFILADEPTGNLDRANSEAFAEFLATENERGRTVVLVTHDERLLGMGNRAVELNSGRLCGTA